VTNQIRSGKGVTQRGLIHLQYPPKRLVVEDIDEFGVFMSKGAFVNKRVFANTSHIMILSAKVAGHSFEWLR
jgi:hypothetical protein